MYYYDLLVYCYSVWVDSRFRPSVLPGSKNLKPTHRKVTRYSQVWSTFSYLIWHGVASIHEQNVVRGVDFEEFLANYAIENDCTRYITLNCVVLACQMRPGINVDNHLDEDNFSIRTVEGWQKTGFAIIGTIQFALAFHLCISYPVGCSIWPQKYYPRFLSGK